MAGIIYEFEKAQDIYRFADEICAFCRGLDRRSNGTDDVSLDPYLVVTFLACKVDGRKCSRARYAVVVISLVAPLGESDVFVFGILFADVGKALLSSIVGFVQASDVARDVDGLGAILVIGCGPHLLVDGVLKVRNCCRVEWDIFQSHHRNFVDWVG